MSTTNNTDKNTDILEWIGDTLHFDATSLNCPLPVLKSKKMIQSILKSGDRLVVKASNNSFEVDYLVLCDAENCVLESVTHQNNCSVYTILKP